MTNIIEGGEKYNEDVKRKTQEHYLYWFLSTNKQEDG